MGSLLRICAVAATCIVSVSFLMFAVDELGEGSQNQVESVHGQHAPAASQAAIDAPAPDPAVERAREKQHSIVREAIDDADDVLLSPFTGIIDTKDVWVRRILPGVLALLLYGLCGMLLANLLPKPHHEVRDWREVQS